MHVHICNSFGKKRNAGVPLPLVAELSAAKRNFMMITEWKLARTQGLAVACCIHDNQQAASCNRSDKLQFKFGFCARYTTTFKCSMWVCAHYESQLFVVFN